MRRYGVNYDTGLKIHGHSTRSHFDPDVARRELQIIATDLHATAVRVSGDDPERIAAAGEHALDAGLELWFSPFPYDLTPDALADFLADSARTAEQIRRAGAEMVLVLGCEMSLFCSGFVPGDGLEGRIATMSDPATWSTAEGREAMATGLTRAREVQRTIVAAARESFAGPITYAAGSWEQVEWELFDFVSVDAYREARNQQSYIDELVALRRFGKPVAITEFGCCTYAGAGDRGGTGWLVLEESNGERRVSEDLQRDETEQVRYLNELLDIFEKEQVDSAFWFSFAGFELPHRRNDPAHDLDLASYGLVAVLDEGTGRAYPDMTWEPKAAFHALATRYPTPQPTPPPAPVRPR